MIAMNRMMSMRLTLTALLANNSFIYKKLAILSYLYEPAEETDLSRLFRQSILRANVQIRYFHFLFAILTVRLMKIGKDYDKAYFAPNRYESMARISQ